MDNNREQSADAEPKAIHLSGLPFGPFPTHKKLAARLKEWVLLPEIEALAFTRKELVRILIDSLKLVEGGMDESVQKIRARGI